VVLLTSLRHPGEGEQNVSKISRECYVNCGEKKGGLPASDRELEGTLRGKGKKLTMWTLEKETALVSRTGTQGGRYKL